MEKINPKWLKKFLAIVLPISIFLSLSMQIFADFAGDGTGSGTPIYPDHGFTQIDINYGSGSGGSSAIDNITFPLIPMFSDGALQSEVARGVYGSATNQYYRYTTLITRSSASRISQKQTFDSPLYNNATSLTVTYYSPIVNSNNFDMVINAVTDNTSNTCRITNISATYKELVTVFDTQSVTDGTLVNADITFVEKQYSSATSLTGGLPYTFRFQDRISDTDNVIIDLKLTFNIAILDTGVFSLSTTSNYASSYTTDTQHFDTVVNNITKNIEYVNVDRVPFAEIVINTLSDIGSIQLFGAFTVGDVLWAFIGIGVTIVFIKLFAGG